MPVSIPISADATAVRVAIQQIQDAIARAGQVGRSFAQLDLSHPELRVLADDIMIVQRRFDDLARVGRGSTAAAVRAIQHNYGVNDPLGWGMQAPNMFPNPMGLQNHMGTVGHHILQGTRWQYVPPGQAAPASSPLPPTPPGSPGIASNFMAGAGSALMSGALSGAGFGAGLMAVNMIKNAVKEGIANAREESVMTDTLMRHGDITSDFTQFRDAIRKSTEGLGLNFIEAQRLSLQWAKLTNDSSPEAIAAGVRVGAGFGRAYGIDPGSAVQGLGQAQYLGMDAGTFARVVGEAVRAGNQSGQAEQVMQSLLRWSEAASRQLITETNTGQFAAMYAGMNKLASDENYPGLRGVNAENIISTVNASLSAGGRAGPAGQAFMYQVARSVGVTNPFDVQRFLEGGIFGSPASAGVGTNTTSLFSATMRRIDQMFPQGGGMGESAREQAMSNLLGINMRTAHALTESYRRGPADIDTSWRAMQRLNIDPDKVNPTGLRDIIEVANASQGDLETIRTRRQNAVGNDALSESDKEELARATPDTLRDTLIRIASRSGQEESVGSIVRRSSADLTNAITMLGSSFLRPIQVATEVTAEVVKAIAIGLGYLTEGTPNDDRPDETVYGATKRDPKTGKWVSDPAGNGMAPLPSGGSGGGTPGLAGAEKTARAKELMEFFMSPEGGSYTRAQALGLVASADAESGMNAQPAGWNDGGQAAGMFQWHGDRRAAIERMARARGWKHTTVETMDWREQAAAHAWELSPEGPEHDAGARLRGANSPDEAGYIETVYDERPRLRYAKGVERGRMATHWDQQLRGGSPVVVHVEPLKVEHRDGAGNLLHEQTLPTTVLYPPSPWGTATEHQPWQQPFMLPSGRQAAPPTQPPPAPPGVRRQPGLPGFLPGQLGGS